MKSKLLMLLLFLVMLLTSMQATEAAWYNDSWNFRTNVTVTENSAALLEEYHVDITIDTETLINEGKLRSDCADLRFTNSSEELIFHYLEQDPVYGCDSGETRVWLKIQELPASGSTTISMYYGNNEASSTSTIESTFNYSSPKLVGYVVNDLTASASYNVISLADNNNITIGATSNVLDDQGTATISNVPLGTAIYAERIYNADSSTDRTDIISPISWTGTNFYMYSQRDTNHFIFLSPYGTAQVTIQDNGNSVWSGTVTSSGLRVSQDITNNQVVRINSSLPILAQHYATSNNGDGIAYYPATKEPLYGTPGNYFEVGSGPNGSSIRYNTSSGGSTPSTLAANAGLSLASLGASGTPPAYLVYGSEPIGANQKADKDGREETTFLPSRQLGTTYGSQKATEYIAVAAPSPNTQCTTYNSAGDEIDTLSGGSLSTVNKIGFGTGSDTQYAAGGWKMVCDKAVHAFFEEDARGDETNLMSHKDIRQKVYPEPTYALGSEEDNPVAPTLSNVQITPANPLRQDNLVCSFMVNDPNEGDQIYANVTWYADGVEATEHNTSKLNVSSEGNHNVTLDSSATFIDQNWTCSVELWDNFGLISEEYNDTVTIQSDWFDANWVYRVQYNITEQEGMNRERATVNITLDTSSLIQQSKMREDCADLRITTTQNEMLYHYTGTCNNESTIIWVNMNLTASTTETINIYYGNLGESSTANRGKALGVLETGTIEVTSEIWQTINFSTTIDHPIIVASPSYSIGPTAPPHPAGVMVTNITSSTARIRADRPEGILNNSVTIHYAVMSSGAWHPENGTALIQAYNHSSSTDAYYTTAAFFSSPSYADIIEYPYPFNNNPVILHTRSSYNSQQWAVTYAGGVGDRTTTPNSTHMDLSLMSGFEGDQNWPGGETIHWIGIEDTTAGNTNNILYSAERSADIVAGWATSPYYWQTSYTQTYSSTPEVVIVAQHKEDGGNGGWAGNPRTQTSASVWAAFVDETSETDRAHATEVVGALSFSEEGTIYLTTHYTSHPTSTSGIEEQGGPLILGTTITPQEIHVNDSVTIRTNVSDTNAIDKVWYKITLPDMTVITDFITTIVDGLWQVVLEFTQRGNYQIEIHANDSTGIETSVAGFNFTLYGYSTITDSNLTNATIYQGDTTTIKCKVEDVNYSVGIENYSVSFYSNETGMIGTNLTNSSGWASYGYKDSSVGIEQISCNITNDTTTYYHTTATINASYEITTLEPVVLTIVSETIDKTQIGYGQTITIDTHLSTLFTITQTDARISTPDSRTETITLAQIAAEDYRGVYSNTFEQGIYNITVLANDTNGDYVEGPVLQFRVRANATLSSRAEYEAYTPLQKAYLATNTNNWWSPLWKKRMEINITENSNTVMHDYEVLITIDTASMIQENKIKNDCGDIRFADDQQRKLDYYQEELPEYQCNTTTTRYWVRVPLLFANHTEQIYMYYNNSNAASESNIVSTFRNFNYETIGYGVSPHFENQGITILALEDQVKVRAGIQTAVLNKGDSTSFSNVAANTPIQSTGLVQINGPDDQTDIITPISHAGTLFAYRSDRYVNNWSMLAPFKTANVTIYDNGVEIWNGEVDSNGLTVQADITDGQNAHIESTEPILVQHVGVNNGIAYDTMSLYPATTEELYGIPSGAYHIGTGTAGATVSWDDSNGGSGGTSLGATTSYETTGHASQGTGVAYKVTSNNPIGVNQQADSDGGETSVFWPGKELGKIYGANSIVQYIAIATPQPQTTCVVYDNLGAVVGNQTSNNSEVNKLYFGDSSTTDYIWQSAGWTMECDKPVYAYFEKEDGASSEPSDETQLMSHKQMRQYTYPEPSYTIGEEENQSTTSTLDNIGGTNIRAQAILTVERNNSGTWDYVETVLNDTNTSKYRIANTGGTINLESLWVEADGWDVSLPLDEYRLTTRIVGPHGRTLSNENGSLMETSAEIKVVQDLINITIVYPADHIIIPNTTLPLIFNVEGYREPESCKVISGPQILADVQTVNENGPTAIEIENLEPRQYVYRVSCLADGAFAISKPRETTFVKANNFGGNTISFGDINDPENVPDVTIEKQAHGRINYRLPINFTNGGDLDSYIIIRDKEIIVNSSMIPHMNVSANLTMYNTNLENPVVLRNSLECTDCSIVQNGENITFSVPHFTSYKVSENSRLEVTDSTETQLQYPGETILFTANYTNTTSTEPIASGSCTITINGTATAMSYNGGTELFEYSRSFTDSGLYFYDVSCSATGYTTLNVSDSATISSYEGPIPPANVTVIEAERRTIDYVDQLVEVQPGNISTINLHNLEVTESWQGFYGNVTGEIVLGNAVNETFYNWERTSPQGEIYITRALDLSFTTLNCTSTEQIIEEERSLNLDENRSDSIANTFSTVTHPSFNVGTVTIQENTCPSTNLFVNELSQDTDYHQIILSDLANHTTYVSIIDDNEVGYDGDNYDFQSLVPVEYDTTTPYYFFIELS